MEENNNITVSIYEIKPCISNIKILTQFSNIYCDLLCIFRTAASIENMCAINVNIVDNSYNIMRHILLKDTYRMNLIQERQIKQSSQ